MKNIDHLKQGILSDDLGRVPNESEATLNVAGIYQDNVTRDWAMQFCRHASRVAGEESVQSSWYNAHSLSDPAFFGDAVGAAVAADVIVVSVYAANELPRDLYVWVETWLPRRRSRLGALTALVGVAEPMDRHSVRTIEYLQAVAHMAQLDFIPRARRRPIVSPPTSTNVNAESPAMTGQALAELYGRRFDAYGL